MRGVIAGGECVRQHQCSDKLAMLEVHAHIALDTGRENRWHVWCIEILVSLR
jgi:hypothetical protein